MLNPKLNKKVKSLQFNKNLVLFSFFIIFLLFLNINLASSEKDDPCELSVSLVNQDPYPATPNNYVNLLFQVNGVDNSECKGARFDLNLEYPFSIDDGTTLKILNSTTYNKDGYKTVWNIPYTLRIDKDALDGIKELEVRYAPLSWSSNSYISKKINISIQNYQTAFDAVIQESTSSGVSIALANIGKYTANAVIVKIPEQDYFSVSSTNGQMVGNLDAGDYTIVSFSISPKYPTNQDLRNENTNKSFNNSRNISHTSKNLSIDVYYTDNLGVRRTVRLGLPLVLQSSTNSTILNIQNFQRKKQSSNSLIWIILSIALVISAVLILIKKFPNSSKKIKEKLNFLSKKKENKKENQIPDWIKNYKEKK